MQLLGAYTVPMHMILVTVVFIFADILTGILKAIYTHGFKSLKMREGLFHKLGEMFCVVFGIICEICFPLIGVTINIPIVSTICIYIVLMEVGSVAENIAAMSPHIEKLLSKVFGEYKQGDE